MQTTDAKFDAVTTTVQANNHILKAEQEKRTSREEKRFRRISVVVAAAGATIGLGSLITLIVRLLLPAAV